MRSKVKPFIVVLLVAATVLAACAPFAGRAPEKTMFVGPYLVDCTGVTPQKCMLVKERPYDDWEYFYDQIEGFSYEPGFDYELVVLQEKVENPPADASNTKYTLVEVVNKERALEGTTWVLDSYLNKEGSMEPALSGSEATIRFQDDQLGGNASCNTYFGSYEVDGSKIEINVGGTTLMACVPQPLAEQEHAYLAALNLARFYLVQENELRLADASGKTILKYSVLQPASLVGTLWEVTGYNNGQGGFSSVIAGTEITAAFGTNGSLTGFSGCNNYATTYSVEGNNISIGQVATTMKFCAEPQGVIEQENAYGAALQAASTYEIEGDSLTLFDFEGTRQAAFQVRKASALIDTPWQATAYNNGRGGFQSVQLGTEITALFGEDGQLTGSAGCNNYSAAYEIDGDTISVGPLATTRMMCAEPEGIMEQEAAYLAALERAATHQIQGDRLELRDKGGSRIAAYVESEETPTAAGECPGKEVLGNLEYPSEFTQTGVAPLEDGKYSEQAAPGSATQTVVRLTKHIACGELNGQPATAVVLVTDPGGSGTFYDLALVMEEDGQPANVATISLGDRPQINSITIENNEIIVDMITHGPGDPMCCPTQQDVRTYALQGDELVLTSSTASASEQGKADGLVGEPWQWIWFSDPVDGPQTIEEPDRYQVEFRAEGQVAVKADCNSASGTYTTEDGGISIEIGPMTMAMCGPESLSDVFVQYLGAARIYRIEDQDLFLDLFADSGTMRLSRGGTN